MYLLGSGGVFSERVVGDRREVRTEEKSEEKRSLNKED